MAEVKTLEGAAKERLDNAIRPETEKDHWPRFYGSWPVQSVLKHLPEREAIQRKLIDRLGRTLRTHIKKGNDQLRAHRERIARNTMVRIVILVNEDHEEYGPDVVRYIVGRELWRTRADGTLRNGDIDAVLYLSERHATPIEGQITFPLLVVAGCHVDESPWKLDTVNLILRRWAEWNAAPLKPSRGISVDQFEAVEHIPQQMRRQELWLLEYRRKPYMRNWRDEDIRNLWDVIILITALAFNRATPMEVPGDGRTKTLEQFTHLQEEIARRGLALDYFRPDPLRIGQAIDALPYGTQVRDWLRLEFKHVLQEQPQLGA